MLTISSQVWALMTIIIDSESRRRDCGPPTQLQTMKLNMLGPTAWFSVKVWFLDNTPLRGCSCRRHSTASLPSQHTQCNYVQSEFTQLGLSPPPHNPGVCSRYPKDLCLLGVLLCSRSSATACLSFPQVTRRLNIM